MCDRASAERACKEPNPIIDGRKANVNLAILGAKPRGNAAVAGEQILRSLMILHCTLSVFRFPRNFRN